MPVGKDVIQVLLPAEDSLVAVVAALHRSHARDDLYVIVHQCQQGIEVASVEGVEGSVDSSTFSCDIAYSDSPRASRASR